MRRRPGPLPGEDTVVAQQEALKLLPRSARRLRGRGAGTRQIAHGLMRCIGHPDGGAFAGAMQPGQREGIAPIGFDVITAAHTAPWLVSSV